MATLHQLYERINAGDVDGFGDLVAENFVEHEETPGLEPTKEGVKAFFRMQIAAFPDMHFHVEDMFASGDRAVARARVTGTHRGALLDIPPTGKAIDVAVIDIMRFDDAGLVAEHWGVFDLMGMMQQLGVVEGPPAG